MSILGSAVCYLLAELTCRVKGRFRPQPPARPTFSYTSDYTLRTLGSCDQGTYVEMYCPTIPFLGNNNTPKVVIYLHGFDLGASRIYGSHLLHLVRQGVYVIYPNFQKGFCQFPTSSWQTVEELIQETIGSGVIRPQGEWMQAALTGAKQAYAALGLATGSVDTYLFGHSLGGLFALSWPYYVKQGSFPDYLLPQQVIVADPVPHTGFHSTGPMRAKLGNFADAIDIAETGKALTVPTAILHGNDDAIAPKEQWVAPFQSIASPDKTMYLSCTDRWGCPALFANHEQCTVDTDFVGTLLALTILDGVGVEDPLDWFYIWSALDQVILLGKRADQLTFQMGDWSDRKSIHPIEIFLSS
jgi:pimeloyl-ACP methyl ester carboxylesterase